MNLDSYTPGHIDSFLLNYKIFVEDMAELARDWPALDAEQRNEQQAIFVQVWGNRHVLGKLYLAHRLTSVQEEQLAQLDQRLLEQAALMELCFSFELAQVLVIFNWGSPLAQSAQPVRIQTDSISLQHLAHALAPVV
ncbi:MAG: hypothetical protein U0350_03875 [Caldilineaceae bacterium]